VFTGCSHAGVVNVTKHAIATVENAALHAVMGGYHLADAEPPALEATVRDLVALNPAIVLPGHCSGWRVKYALEKELPGRLAPSTVGTKFNFI
jgi:7,8-dihydropterin-6-yl-methyl-4-(beta-D-ribofuranosyl)aminobenzene 5'-phosphate synthase